MTVTNVEVENEPVPGQGIPAQDHGDGTVPTSPAEAPTVTEVENEAPAGTGLPANTFPT